MLKFTTMKAGEVDPETLVITRTDGQSVKTDAMYLVVNLNKPHGREIYEVLKKYGYDIPEVQRYLDMLPTFGQILESIATLLKPDVSGLTPVFNGVFIRFQSAQDVTYGEISKGIFGDLSLKILNRTTNRPNYKGHETNKQLSTFIRNLNKDIYSAVQNNLDLLEEPIFITGDSTSKRKDFQQMLKENGLANYEQFKQFCKLDFTEYC